MPFTVIIPARYASSRLPAKPLLSIADKPMIQHVCERAAASQAERVIVATDDSRISTSVESFGAQVCMTRADHATGTDRLQEVVSQLGYADDHIVVNVQGDEPLIPPQLINQVADNLASNPTCAVATLATPIDNAAELFDPNVVKVVVGMQGRALYFSRAPVPWDRDRFPNSFDAQAGSAPFWRHVGIYAYRVGLLHQFATWPPSPLESCEKLEQLRILSQGEAIHVEPACTAPAPGVDTQDDLEQVRALIRREGTDATVS